MLSRLSQEDKLSYRNIGLSGIYLHRLVLYLICTGKYHRSNKTSTENISWKQIIIRNMANLSYNT